jgi:hypothetical protein
MAKTSKQIQGDVYRLLQDSVLSGMISGEVYRSGYRPRDSNREDAVVIFTTGLPDEVQTGVVTVNIYVPDTDLYGNGVLVEDGQRTEEIERLANDWVNSLTDPPISPVINSGFNKPFTRRLNLTSISISSL